MGKRRKTISSAEAKTHSNRKNKKIKLVNNTDTDKINETSTVQLNTHKEKQTEPECELLAMTASTKKIKKAKKNKMQDNLEKSEILYQSIEVAEPNSKFVKLPTPSVNKKEKTSTKNNSNSELQNKKIIFTDEEALEGNNDLINKQNKTKKTVQSQEEDVKDEDIDKFCEEINEEDNEQYENWVKLIEAKLSGSNKKKPK